MGSPFVPAFLPIPSESLSKSMAVATYILTNPRKYFIIKYSPNSAQLHNLSLPLIRGRSPEG